MHTFRSVMKQKRRSAGCSYSDPRIVSQVRSAGMPCWSYTDWAWNHKDAWTRLNLATGLSESVPASQPLLATN